MNDAAAAAATPLPLISRGVPAYTNDNCGGAYPAGLANDASYDTQWRACGSPSSGAPIFLAYDLSSVPAANRGQVVVAWYNDPMTVPYDHTYVPISHCCTWLAYNLPSSYFLEANAAPGGSLPSSGWVTLVTVSGNHYHSRQHLIALTGYNWLRITVTASDGSSGNVGVAANLDVHDASAGVQDDWIFFGDSITEAAMSHNPLAASGGTGTWAQLINAANPSYFPAAEDGRDRRDTEGRWGQQHQHLARALPRPLRRSLLRHQRRRLQRQPHDLLQQLRHHAPSRPGGGQDPSRAEDPVGLHRHDPDERPSAQPTDRCALRRLSADRPRP